MPMDATPGKPRFLPIVSYKLVFVLGNVGNATEAILFTVDAALSIPGQEDSGLSTPSRMWYIIVGLIAGPYVSVGLVFFRVFCLSFVSGECWFGAVENCLL